MFKTVNSICRNPDLAIPDNTTVTDTVTITTTGPLTDLNVSLDATHTYVGDLVFRLRHDETGTVVNLFNRPIGGNGDCSGDDIAAMLDDEGPTPVDQECGGGVPTIDGTFIPSAPLSGFDGEDLSGSWTILVSDQAAQDVGTLNQWCLQPAQ
jgi:subtilisin-like proprotein convertase family protein